MANEKFLKGRFQQKIDTEENWNKAKNFVPLDGEIIVYKDIKKLKVGDGVTTVEELEFYSGDFDERILDEYVKKGDLERKQKMVVGIDYTTKMATHKPPEILAATKEGRAIVLEYGSESYTSTLFLAHVSDNYAEFSRTLEDPCQHIITIHDDGTFDEQERWFLDNTAFDKLTEKIGKFQPLDVIIDRETMFATHMPSEMLQHINNGGSITARVVERHGDGSIYQWSICLVRVDESDAYFIETWDEDIFNMWVVNNNKKVFTHEMDTAQYSPTVHKLQKDVSGLESAISNIPISNSENGGAVLNDIDKNKAGAFATALGSETNAPGRGAVASGVKKDRSGAPDIPAESDWRYTEAHGTGSLAAGMGAVAYSRASKSLGYRTQTGRPVDEAAAGDRIEAKQYGYAAENAGQAAVAIGSDTVAYGNNSLAGGYQSVASNAQAIALGTKVEASGNQAIALGSNFFNTDNSIVPTKASGDKTIAIGSGVEASGNQSIAIGFKVAARANGQMVLGKLNVPDENANFIIANGLGDNNVIYPDSRHNTVTIDKQDNVLIDSNNLELKTLDSISASCSNTAKLDCGSFEANALGSALLKAEENADIQSTTGNINIKTKSGHKDTQGVSITTAHFAAGDSVTASGNKAVALGYLSKAEGAYSLACGYNNTSKANYSYTFGQNCTAEGNSSIALGAHASTGISASAAVAMGSSVQAKGSYSVAMGERSVAAGYGSTAMGRDSVTATNAAFQVVIGRFNAYENGVINNAAFVIGNGTDIDTAKRANIFTVEKDGNVKAQGQYGSMGADYAEMFEWQDGNPDKEDRIGYVVTLDREKIRFAQPGDDILGVISGTAAVLGDSAAMHWKDRYVTDEFGRIVYDEVEEFTEEEDPETKEVTKVSLGFAKHPRINPEYDPESIYIAREERPEWGKVGMMGKLYTRDDGTCVPGGYCIVGADGVLTHSETPTNIRVMKRTGENIVWVLLK